MYLVDRALVENSQSPQKVLEDKLNEMENFLIHVKSYNSIKETVVMETTENKKKVYTIIMKY